MTDSEHPGAGYDRLTQLDNSFLIYESRESPMHVASTGIFEAAPLRTASGGLDIQRIEDYVASRLHAIPRYRQHIVRTPLRDHPVWADDEHFNLRYHVRHTRLPDPGDARKLKRLAGRVLSQQLDLTKPAWEMWVVEGLEDDRFAVITKVHHCMIDGVSGADLLKVLLSVEPVEKPDSPRPWQARRTPGRLAMGFDELMHTARTPFEIGEAAWRVVTDEEGARGDFLERLRAMGRMVSGGLGVSETSINQPIGPYRRIDWLRMDLDAVRAVKNRLGGSINDIVLATVAGALRSFLGECRGEPVDELEFRVLAPVSVRSSSDAGTLGNRVAAWIVRLPLDEPDAFRRLGRVREATEELKASHQALAAEALTQVSEWTGSGLMELGARLVQGAPPFNMVVTNVPGPQLPLYLLEARMLEAHPMVPLFQGLTTGIALFSYDGQLCWGFSGDWDRVPDLHDLVLAVEESFAELERAAAAAS